MSTDDVRFGDDEWIGSVEQFLHREVGGLPDCVRIEGARCLDCPFGDWRRCPILLDPDVRSYLQWQGERTIEYYRDRERKLTALRGVFRNHKIPLHWEIVARIVQEEDPSLFESPRSIRNLLFLNQDIFHHDGDGVFELREHRKSGGSSRG